MSTSGIVVHYNFPRKYTVLSGNFVFSVYDFDLHDRFQERNPSIK